MKSVLATFQVIVDVEDNATIDEIQTDVRGAILDYMMQEWEVEITNL